MPLKSKGKKKAGSKKVKAGGALKGVVKTGQALLGGKSSGGGRRRSHGVQWYANAVLKAKLKKKLNRIRYGGI